MLKHTADREDRKVENILLWRDTNVLQCLTDYKLHLNIYGYKGECAYKIHIKNLVVPKIFPSEILLCKDVPCTEIVNDKVSVLSECHKSLDPFQKSG